jgi:Big-like domain-containing protein
MLWLPSLPGTPCVVSIIPADNATDINPDANIMAKFSEAVKATSINANCFRPYQGNFTYEGGY